MIDVLLPWEEGWAAVSWYSPLLVRLLMLKMLTHSAWLPFLLLLCVVSTLWGYPFRPPLDLDVTPRTTVLSNGMIHMFCFLLIHIILKRKIHQSDKSLLLWKQIMAKSSVSIHTHKALLISQSSLSTLSNYLYIYIFVYIYIWCKYDFLIIYICHQRCFKWIKSGNCKRFLFEKKHFFNNNYNKIQLQAAIIGAKHYRTGKTASIRPTIAIRNCRHFKMIVVKMAKYNH